jgi:GxxExxY protein
MPIEIPEVGRFSSGEFRALDYEVMRCAFESQNDLGRLCDERIYRADLAARLIAAGIGARCEVPIKVSHLDFTKVYELDLIAGDQFIYELKTVANLVGEHEGQLLNYLLLTNAAHGKLINFRPTKVESKFVNAPVDEVRRRQALKVDGRFSPDAANLKNLMLDLLKDWGAYLEIALYTQALTHFLGGEDRVITQVPMQRDGIPLGNQRFHLYNPESAFRVTAFKSNLKAQEDHLKRQLTLTPLKSIHWINLHHTNISFTTIT